MGLFEPKQRIEPPSKVAVVRGLCSIVASLPPDLNTQRFALEEAADFLSPDPPHLTGALRLLNEAYAHAFRDLYRESRPEVWLVAAAVALLR